MARKPALMLQGTGSNVGKSILVAGLARALLRRGLKIAPFKPQNMSNNAGVANGGEIGRAQMLQAHAAGLTPDIHMNPVLLKPETDLGAQIIVQGQFVGTMKARDYGKHKTTLMPKVMESFETLEKQYDLVLVEGAGSPAEINLRAGDIANMGFAEAADVPVILIGDIDRGGVIASLVGTHAVLPAIEQSRIKGFVVNKFRGDVSLFADGMTEIANRTHWSPLGVLPFFQKAQLLPAEDILDLRSDTKPTGNFRIVVPKLPRIANFDDLDPLAAEPNVSVNIIEQGRPLPQNADLILLPGSKSTIADLAALKSEGWDLDIAAHLRHGKPVMGLCGGYQMLGKRIFDPNCVEGSTRSVDGLGYLDVETILDPSKTTRPSRGVHRESGLPVEGYEIHLGQTKGTDCRRPFVEIDGKIEGAQSKDGLVTGTYMHGIFSSDEFRRYFLENLGATASNYNYSQSIDQVLDELAQHLEAHLDIDQMLKIAYARDA